MTLKLIPTVTLLGSLTFTPLASAMIEEEEGAISPSHAVLTVKNDEERLPFIDEQGQDVLENRTSRDEQGQDVLEWRASRASAQQEQTCITDRCFMRSIASICCVGVIVITLIRLKNAHYF